MDSDWSKLVYGVLQCAKSDTPLNECCSMPSKVTFILLSFWHNNNVCHLRQPHNAINLRALHTFFYLQNGKQKKIISSKLFHANPNNYFIFHHSHKKKNIFMKMSPNFNSLSKIKIHIK